jgi:hypothetical protein
VPILYIPYGLFPVQRERQSGFLFPRFGYSNDAASRSSSRSIPRHQQEPRRDDLARPRDEARIGALGEYRYALSPETLRRVQRLVFQRADPRRELARHRQLADRRPEHPDRPLERGVTHDQWLPYGSRASPTCCA